MSPLYLSLIVSDGLMVVLSAVRSRRFGKCPGQKSSRDKLEVARKHIERMPWLYALVQAGVTGSASPGPGYSGLGVGKY